MRGRSDKIQRNCFLKKYENCDCAVLRVEASLHVAYKVGNEREPKERNQMKPEQVVELIDKLVSERLKLHMVQTSKSFGENPVKQSLTVDLEKKIVQIKTNLVEALRA